MMNQKGRRFPAAFLILPISLPKGRVPSAKREIAFAQHPMCSF
jgi:hypothetical protein